jgi:hypothetical protein
VYSATGKAPDGSPIFGIAWRPSIVVPTVPALVGVPEPRARQSGPTGNARKKKRAK